MTHLLRGKQAGINNDLSAGLGPDFFALDDVLRYGVNSQVSTVAYDPVQSLLAVGTRNTQFGPGQIYIFGQKRIQITLPLAVKGASVKSLQFCADKLVCLDNRHDISVYSLELKKLRSSHSPPGVVTCLCTDPTLDYALLGMQTGDVLAYDLDRENLAPFKIPNLWQQVDPRARAVGVVSLQFHPREIGSLLIGYATGAVIYSFKLNKAIRHFQYEVPRFAPGGDSDPSAAGTVRRPRLTQAVWHPTGTFIMTGHEDSSIVFWDTIKDGRILMARTLTDTNVATPGASTGSVAYQSGPISMKEPLFKIAWCANQDPDDTAILIAAGQSTQSPTKGLTLFEMGRTPVYATSTWDGLSHHFASPKRQRILPTPLGVEVVEFCLVPRTSPHFAGAHDPIAVIAVLSSGELLSMTFPSGMPICPTNQLPVSLSFVHPYIKQIDSTSIERERWLGMTERRQQGPQFVSGGVESPRPMRRFEDRNVIQTVHTDGTIRLWDVGHGDEVENDKVLQVDVATAVGHYDNINITATSLAGGSGELAVGLQSGELIVFRWGVNRHAGREPPSSGPNTPQALTNVSSRVEPSLNEGLVPATLLDQQDGPATAVCMSDIGFVAAGFEGGSFVVVDMRGPAIIYTGSIQDLTRSRHKGGSLRRRGSSSAGEKPEWVTKMSFSIMMLENDSYSSILLHAGTNLGHLATLKILPDPSGRYTVQYVGSVALEHKISYIHPIDVNTGGTLRASQRAMGNLANGLKQNGALIAVTPTSIHIFRPATSKGAHKTFDSSFCDAAGVIRSPPSSSSPSSHALACLFGDGTLRVYSLPNLRELASLPASSHLDVRRFPDAKITTSGHILGFTGPSELAVLNCFGTGEHLPTSSPDQIFMPNALIPPRPTISTVQWVTGTQYITSADMDILIGGPDRPPSKRMIAQSRAEEEQRLRAGSSRTAASSSSAGDAQSQEGYWAYMQRQLAERTEKLGIVGDSMDNLEQNSASWAEEVNKFVTKQKRNAAGGIIKAKFGF